MAHALLPICQRALLIGLAAAAGAAAAGGPPRDSERRTTNSLNLVYSATTPAAPAKAPTQPK